MEQDNENRMTDNGQPVENDLFATMEDTPSKSCGDPSVSEAAADSAAEPEQKTDNPSEMIKEPEFKVNSDSRFSVRMIENHVSAADAAEKNLEKSEKKPISLRTGTDASLGQLLSEARIAAGYSIDQVCQETRIRIDYVEALEQDKTETLPNIVFLRAYVRALIKLYGLDADSYAMFEDRLKNMEPETEVPEKLLEDIGKKGQINETEARRLKMFLTYGSIILVLLISLVVTSAVSISIRNSRRQAMQLQQENRPFDSSRIETLIGPQLPQPKMLQIPSSTEGQKSPR